MITSNCALGFGSLLDTMLTAILIYYLRQSRHFFEEKKGVFQTLMFYTINTGATTVIVSFVIFFSLNFMPHGTLYSGFGVVLSELYANSVLGLLNSRIRIKRQALSSELWSVALDPPPECQNAMSQVGLRIRVLKTSETQQILLPARDIRLPVCACPSVLAGSDSVV